MYKVGGLFSGVGGIELGFEKAGFEIAWANEIDKNMQKINSYYFDLRKGRVLDSLKVRVVKKGGFVQHMKSIGKLGGQNKVPRLSNDRSVANSLLNYEKKS